MFNSQNYYDIRESSGFKNVSLAVSTIARVDVSCVDLSFRTSLQLRHQVSLTVSNDNVALLTFARIDEEVTFIHPDDLSLYNMWESHALELQVANHELLGHGSGKLFQEAADGSKNFDPENVCNALPECDHSLKLHVPGH